MARSIAWAICALLLACAPHAPDPQDADALYLPTPHPVVEAMLRLAEVRANDVLYDRGAGDGRIVIAAVRLYGIRAVGIELDARKVAEARANVARAGLGSRVEIRQGDGPQRSQRGHAVSVSGAQCASRAQTALRAGTRGAHRVASVRARRLGARSAH
jgi:precorrin-6B methylase 2